MAPGTQSTPGAGPLWCFVMNGKIEYSVTVDRDTVHLYVMETDNEIVFADADKLMAWLRSNRAEAAQEPTAPVSAKARFRRFTRVGLSSRAPPTRWRCHRVAEL